MDMTSAGERLGALLEDSGIPGREADRLAERPEGQGALIIARKQRSLREDVARAYARTFGCSVGWLLAGEGPRPTPEQVRAAVARARAAADAAHPSPDGPVVVREGFDQRAEEG